MLPVPVTTLMTGLPSQSLEQPIAPVIVPSLPAESRINSVPEADMLPPPRNVNRPLKVYLRKVIVTLPLVVVTSINVGEVTPDLGLLRASGNVGNSIFTSPPLLLRALMVLS